MPAVRFRAYGPDVYMGTARLNADAVRGLIAIFNRERAWGLMDELNAAAAEATDADRARLAPLWGLPETEGPTS
jgi:hypothetical protein